MNSSKGYTVSALDAGQLDHMWKFLMLQRRNHCVKEDVRRLKQDLDKIRQAMIQKNGGQRDETQSGHHAEYVKFEELGTYINFVVTDAMALYLYGGLDALEQALPEEVEL